MNNNVLESFGTIIRRERERLNLSQEAFADLCGFHRTYIGGIERGERNPGLLNIIRIAKALNIPLSVLFRDIDDEAKQ